MSIRYPIALAYFAICTHAAAQVSVAATDAPYTRIGLYNAQPGHALLAGANEALLPNYKSFTGTAFGEKRFLLNDLSLVQLGLVLPVNSGAFGVQATSFGSAAHRQSNLGLAYGRRLTERFNVGVQFQYLHYSIAGYGQMGAVNAAASVLYQLSSTLSAGVQVDGLTGKALGLWKSDKVPRVFSAGLGYAPSTSFFAEATVLKEGAMPIDVQTSLQYEVQNKLVVKGGFTTATSSFYFGGGYRMGALQLEATASWHSHLGISPGLMVTYQKAKE